MPVDHHAWTRAVSLPFTESRGGLAPSTLALYGAYQLSSKADLETAEAAAAKTNGIARRVLVDYPGKLQTGTRVEEHAKDNVIIWRPAIKAVTESDDETSAKKEDKKKASPSAPCPCGCTNATSIAPAHSTWPPLMQYAPIPTHHVLSPPQHMPFQHRQHTYVLQQSPQRIETKPHGDRQSRSIFDLSSSSYATRSGFMPNAIPANGHYYRYRQM